MPRTVRHADLVARALGALCESERAWVDQALETDPRLRRQFEQISGHLLQYDHLPPAPPPPPYARLAAAIQADLEGAHPRDAAPDLKVLDLLDASARRERTGAIRAGRPPNHSGQRRPSGQRDHSGHGLGLVRAGRPIWIPAAAALILACVLIWAPWQERRERAELSLVAGAGIELIRDGIALPAPARARVALQRGDILRCAAPAEARLGDRIRLVLDAGAQLRIGQFRFGQATAVALQAGRAWFEVDPMKGSIPRPAGSVRFEVDTSHGPVRVLGTIFEVDVRGTSLDVAVERGRVQAGGRIVAAGERLVGGALKQHVQRPGAWFRRPTLRLEAPGPGPHPLREALTLRLVFSNPSHLPMQLAAPAAARTPLWLSFETPEGKVLRDLPVLSGQVRAGADLLKPGRGLDLSPGESRVITLEILPPVGSPGAYRCRALYRPAGQQPLLSSTLAFEVR